MSNLGATPTATPAGRRGARVVLAVPSWEEMCGRPLLAGFCLITDHLINYLLTFWCPIRGTDTSAEVLVHAYSTALRCVRESCMVRQF